MFWIVGGALVVVLLAREVWDAYGIAIDVGPSVKLMDRIRSEIRRIQLASAESLPVRSPEGAVLDTSMHAADRATTIVGNAVQFAYAIDRDERGVSHVVASKLVGLRSEGFFDRCISEVVGALASQLSAAGIEAPEDAFEVDRSSGAVVYLTLHLDPEQHAAMVRVEPAYWVGPPSS